MTQQPVEMILARQLAGYLSVPVILVDTVGTVVFYNEPAERMLGVRFEETGRIEQEEADRLVELSDDPAAKPGDADRPLEIALEERRPAHAHRLMLRRSDRVRLQIEVTAFPLIGQEGEAAGGRGDVLGATRAVNVTLYGVRGSLATPGPSTARYGGNTSCVRLTGSDGWVVVLDAGTGIRPLALDLPRGTDPGRRAAHAPPHGPHPRPGVLRSAL